MLFLAAKKLGCPPEYLKKRVDEVSYLKMVMDYEREMTKDYVELKLIEAIQKGESWALKFYASTQMRDRGYGDKSEVTLNASISIPFMPRRGDLPVFGKPQELKNITVTATPQLPDSSEAAEAPQAEAVPAAIVVEPVAVE